MLVSELSGCIPVLPLFWVEHVQYFVYFSQILNFIYLVFFVFSKEWQISQSHLCWPQQYATEQDCPASKTLKPKSGQHSFLILLWGDPWSSERSQTGLIQLNFHVLSQFLCLWVCLCFVCFFVCFFEKDFILLYLLSFFFLFCFHFMKAQ